MADIHPDTPIRLSLKHLVGGVVAIVVFITGAFWTVSELQFGGLQEDIRDLRDDIADVREDYAGEDTTLRGQINGAQASLVDRINASEMNVIAEIHINRNLITGISARQDGFDTALNDIQGNLKSLESKLVATTARPGEVYATLAAGKFSLPPWLGLIKTGSMAELAKTYKGDAPFLVIGPDAESWGLIQKYQAEEFPDPSKTRP